MDAAAKQQPLRLLTPGVGQALVYDRTRAESERMALDADPQPTDYPLLVVEIGLTAPTLASVGAAVRTMARDLIIAAAVIEGQHGTLVSFAFNLGHSTAPGKPLANIAATLNRGDYDGAFRRMGLYVKQRQNGRLVTVPGLVNRRAAEAGLWARGEFVASRHVAPAAPPTEGAEAAKLGGYAAAAATAAPAMQALAGVPVWLGVALVVAVAVVAVALLLRRERAT